MEQNTKDFTVCISNFSYNICWNARCLVEFVVLTPPLLLPDSDPTRLRTLEPPPPLLSSPPLLLCGQNVIMFTKWKETDEVKGLRLSQRWSFKVEVFWGVTSCSFVVGYQRGTPKRLYSTTKLHDITTQKTSTYNVQALKFATHDQDRSMLKSTLI
jgi:hypothetical protein